jgi:hypothetical protein
MSCSSGKVSYRHRGAAVAAQRKIDRKRGVLLHVYECGSCRRWHLGNDRETRLENMNRLFDRLPMSGRALVCTPTGGERR